jgi:hypothetical protein
MSFGLGKDEAESSLKDALNDKINQGLFRLATIISDRLRDENDKDKGHSGANERSYEYLGGKKKSKYNSGRKSIINWGPKGK